jgi:hypothetical protein
MLEKVLPFFLLFTEFTVEPKNVVVRHRIPFNTRFKYAVIFTYINNNSMALVRERTIPTDRLPPFGEVSANFSR